MIISRKKKEIGSEFWDIPVSEQGNNIFPERTRWFISGTAALESIIIDILNNNRIKTVALPSWCCNCMITPFLKYGIDVEFYPVYMKDGTLTCDYETVSADCWVLISYFGYTSQLNKGRPSGTIIRDLTHSIFSNESFEADYYFGSLRKWAGFFTGGFAWSDAWSSEPSFSVCDTSYIELRRTAMNLKKQYIHGVIETKEYLNLFERGEAFLDHCEPMLAYDLDVEKAVHLDWEFIKEKRRKNASILLDSLGSWAIFPEMKDEDCPLFVPLLLDTEKRDALRNYLRGKSIYCPIHWSIEPEHQLTDLTADLYKREISIVCDQRYDEEDMFMILNAIKESGLI